VTATVEVEHLTKRYGSARGCEDVSFTVDAGTVFGFLGPNGAGKSTIMRTVLDFQRATSGTALLFGLDSRRDAVAIHGRTGYLPGDLVLFEKLTGREHVRLFGRSRTVSAAVVDGLVDRFGVELDRPVKELSKGNRQKVGLLMAFAHEPELLVLDEPTSGLDPLVQEEFHSYLRERASAGATVILSSHVLDEVQRIADRVTVIREGRVVVTDTIAALQATVPRRMKLEFEDAVDRSWFAGIPGVEVVDGSDRTVVLTVHGSVDAVVKAAAAHRTRDITAAPADLEALFLGYYQGSDDRGSRDDG
jgi:beta-exotoxin I transport system ATP-binding protein